MSAGDTGTAGRRGRWIPWVFVGGFGVMLLANLIMIALAFDSWTGLTTENAYRAGLSYNETLRERSAARRLGWQVAGAFRSIDGRQGRLIVELRARNGEPLDGAVIEADLRRPGAAARDFTVDLSNQGRGRYAARVTFPLSGMWNAHYRIVRGDERMAARQRLEVR